MVPKRSQEPPLVIGGFQGTSRGLQMLHGVAWSGSGDPRGIYCVTTAYQRVSGSFNETSAASEGFHEQRCQMVFLKNLNDSFEKSVSHTKSV